MIRRAVATFTLDTGKCPRWLFERMVKLGRSMVEIIIDEFGPDEFVERVSDPAWFQSLGTVLAFDWNASGLTTILTASLKEAIRGREKDLGIFICGGKGKTSLKTPDEILFWGQRLALAESNVNSLAYNSRMAAKIDSCLVQDGYQIYHHTFFFSRNGTWTVVQQGMNTLSGTARRYHWHSETAKNLVCEPHSGIISHDKGMCLNLTARDSEKTRQLSTELVQGNYGGLMSDIKILRRHSTPVSRLLAVKSGQQEFVFLDLKDAEFHTHPVINEDFSKSAYLERILWKVCQHRPADYEQLVAMAGVGPKTVRTLSLVSEVIYGARPSYEDPARYSFAHGGKDATPYPVDRKAYDRTIRFFIEVIQKMKAAESEKKKMMFRLLGTQDYTSGGER